MGKLGLVKPGLLDWLASVKRGWLRPAIVAGLLAVFSSPVLANLVRQDSELIAGEELEFGLETIDEYQQIYYLNDGDKVFLTSGQQNYSDPSAKGAFVVWVKTVNGAGQIERHDLDSGAVIALTSLGTNLNPSVSIEGKVVWERWVENRWQIWLFDGMEVRQLTEGDVAVNADIEADKVVFDRQDSTGTWRVEEYDLVKGVTNTVTTGLTARQPRLIKGEVSPGAY